MRIGLATWHLDRQVGIGTYARRYLSLLGEVDPGTEYLVYSAHPVHGLDLPQNVELRNYDVPPRRGRLLAWESVTVPRQAARDEVDLLHFLYAAGPLRWSNGLVVNVFDVISWALPGYGGRWLYEALSRRAARRADRVITLSESAREDLGRLLGLAADRTAVIPLAGPPVTGGRKDVKPYWLFVGGTEHRKNLPLALQAFARLERTDMRLRVVGDISPAPIRDDPEVLTSRIPEEVADRVEWLGFVDDEELERLYAGATALLFPSRYEGFGLPVLEAMARRTPVITSNVSSLPEVASGAALMVDPDDPDALVLAMRRVADDEGLRQELVDAGLEVLSRYSWRATAERTVEVYRELV